MKTFIPKSRVVNATEEQGDAIVQAIYLMIREDKPALVDMLNRCSSLVTDETSQKELFRESMNALMTCKAFRIDLQDYLTAHALGKQDEVRGIRSVFTSIKGIPSQLRKKGRIFVQSFKEGGMERNSENPMERESRLKGRTLSRFSGFVGDDDNWNYGDGDKNKTGAGQVLSTLGSQENITALIGAGMGYLTTSLQNKANAKGNKDAIAYEEAKAKSALAQAQLEALKQSSAPATTTTTTKKKWVVPVIIGGVVVVGLVTFLILRKKK
jgi:hypothetical protein